MLALRRSFSALAAVVLGAACGTPSRGKESGEPAQTKQGAAAPAVAGSRDASDPASGASPTPAAKPAEPNPAEPKPEPEPESKSKPEPATILMPPGDVADARAIILTDAGLETLSAAGTGSLLAAAPSDLDCDVDLWHRVIWTASKARIAAFVPERGELKPVVDSRAVTVSDIEFRWRIQVPDGEFPRVTSGTADGLHSCAALVVELGPTPTATGALIAEGDREVYCIEDEGQPSAEAQAERDDYARARITDAALLQAIAKRRRPSSPAGWAPLKAPASPKVQVDRTRCEADPDDCGHATYLGGGRLWSVTTGNFRGDFFHEDTQLYDATGKVFWDPESGRRGPKPAGEEHSAQPLHVSPDGSWGLYGNQRLSLREAKVQGTFPGSFCGWEFPASAS